MLPLASAPPGGVPGQFSPRSQSVATLVAVEKHRGVAISASAAIAVPADFAFPAVETILNEFARAPGRAALALNVRQLHLPFQATISVAVHARVLPGEAHNEWRLQIRAAQHAPMYPTFEGLLKLLPAGRTGAQLLIDGRYTPPFGPLGRSIDATIMRGAAQSSLQRFVREVAFRVVALAHWAAPP